MLVGCYIPELDFPEESFYFFIGLEHVPAGLPTGGRQATENGRRPISK